MFSDSQIKRFIARIKEDEELIREQIILLKAKDDLIIAQGTALNTKIDNLTIQVTLKLKNLENRIKVLEGA